jgi:hypothetical protein
MVIDGTVAFPLADEQRTGPQKLAKSIQNQSFVCLDRTFPTS